MNKFEEYTARFRKTYGTGMAERLAARHILNEEGKLEGLDESTQRQIVDSYIDIQTGVAGSANISKMEHMQSQINRIHIIALEDALSHLQVGNYGKAEKLIRAMRASLVMAESDEEEQVS